MTLRIVCSVSDRDNWTLRPCAYLLNKYWSEQQPVVVAGYTPPNFDLPANFTFHSIDSYNYPADRWTDGLLKFFESVRDEHFIFMYSDFWLRRTVDWQAVASLHDYAQDHPNVYRIDLGTDRLYTHDPRYMPDYERYGRLNLIQSHPDWAYHHSTQLGLFQRQKFISLLQSNWSPWDFELKGAALVKPEWLVLGTRQIPCDYKHVLTGGVLDLEGIDPEHVRHMRNQGWLP